MTIESVNMEATNDLEESSTGSVEGTTAWLGWD